MKKLCVILCLLLAAISLYANDTYFYMASGQLVPVEEADVEVEMKEEVISIILENRYYEVTVDFTFFNHGETVTLDTGFPFFCVGLQGSGEITDFKCWTNGVETSYVDYPIVKEWATDTELENAYVRSITFPSQQITTTRITYKSSYGEEAPSFSIAKYLYGTGSSWKNAIGKMTVRLQNKRALSYPRTVFLPAGGSLTPVGTDTWEGVFTNVEPEKYQDSITIELGNIFGDNGPRILTQDRYFAFRKKLTEEDLTMYTSAQLRLIRNAIYAFHGYPFKSQDLIDLFENDCADAGWYLPLKEYPLDTSFTENKFSDIEKYNVYFILDEENRRAALFN